jgi:hypothetical protein
VRGFKAENDSYVEQGQQKKKEREKSKPFIIGG